MGNNGRQEKDTREVQRGKRWQYHVFRLIGCTAWALAFLRLRTLSLRAQFLERKLEKRPHSCCWLPKAFLKSRETLFQSPQMLRQSAMEQKSVARDSRRKYVRAGNQLAIVLALHWETKWRHTRDNQGVSIL